MKKLAVIFILCLTIFSSCAQKQEFIPPSGQYTLKCKIGEISYSLFLELSDDLSGKLSFAEDCAMSDWYFTRSSDGKIKCFTSLGSESEVKQDKVDMIFDFVTLSYEKIADVSHEKISGRDVSVLKMSDGSKIYTDSQSGAPLRLSYGDMTVDIISRPE